MQIAACYIRVSTDEQLEFSPDAQKRAIVEYAKRNSLVLSDEFIYIDEGISGRKAEKRPAFMNMIMQAKKKPRVFDMILVHKLDRFARNREDSVVYKSLLRKECGIQVVSVTEKIEDDKFSVILEAMLEAMAEYYSLNLSDEVMKGMTEKARRGGVLGKAPFGYKNTNDGRPPMIVREEADIVKLMFEKIYSKEMTPFTLVRYLNESGIKTRKSKTWSVSTAKYLLRNPFYAGLIVWNRQDGGTYKLKDKSEWITAKGQHEAIIDSLIFNRVQQILGDKNKRERPVSEYCHWLSGLVKCSNCGGSLSVSSKNAFPYFQCSRYDKGKCGVSHYAPMYMIENAVIVALSSFITNPIVDIQYEEKKTQGNVDKIDNRQFLNGELRKAKYKLERVKLAFSTGIDSLDEYKENKCKITEEIAKIQHKIDQDSATMAETFASKNSEKKQSGIADVMSMMQSRCYSIEQKNTALKSFISRIVFNKHTMSIEVYFFCN